MRTKLLLLIGCCCLILAVAVSCSKRTGPLGSTKNPIRFYFMPLKGEEVFTTNAKLIANSIEKSTGLVVKVTEAPDFVTIIKALGTGDADIAFMNTLGFLLARDWAGANAHLKYLYGDVYSTYRGELIARADSGIDKPEDMNGKIVAFTDPYSAAGYLYALKYLTDHNITPKQTLFAGGHKKALAMVYEGKADIAATYHEKPTASGLARDARTELLKDHPDAITALKIVALTDPIPTGPVAVRKKLSSETTAKLVGALIGFARTAEGRQALYDLYNITGLAAASNADYDGVQKVIKELGKRVQDLVPGGAPYYKTAIEIGLE